MKPLSLFALLLFALIECSVFAQSHTNGLRQNPQIPTVFENDSVYYHFGKWYDIDKLPEGFYWGLEHLEKVNMTRDSIRYYVSMGGQEDSLRIYAFRQMLRLDSVKYVVIEKTGPEFKGMIGGGNELCCLEDGAWLFSVSYDVRFTQRMKPPLCRSLVLHISNNDPSFMAMEFRNVTARVSPSYPLSQSLNHFKPGQTYVSIIKLDDPAMSKPGPALNYDLDIEGEIHGERILPDGTILTGKLYDFRFCIRRDRAPTELNYIRPYRPFEAN